MAREMRTDQDTATVQAFRETARKHQFSWRLWLAWQGLVGQWLPLVALAGRGSVER